MTTTTIYCKVQNRLGAIDRVLSAFTHRGILPMKIRSTMKEAENAIEISVTFSGCDSKTIEKLVKFLQKQVYILESGMFSHDAQATESEIAEDVTTAVSSNKVSSLAAAASIRTPQSSSYSSSRVG
jgi:acetolactate synthase small subunit